MRFLLVHSVHNSFRFSRIHLNFALGQRFFSVKLEINLIF
jgi:hypothetical protein